MTAADDAWVGYDSRGMPLLVGRAPFYHWQPPDLADPGNPLIPHSQIGTTSPYVEAARVLNAGAARAGGISVDPVAAHEPVTVSCWRSYGTVHVLLGNLESGWMGDARFPRRLTVNLPRTRLGLSADADMVLTPANLDAPSIEPDASSTPDLLRFSLTVGPAACVVLRLEPRPLA